MGVGSRLLAAQCVWTAVLVLVACLAACGKNGGSVTGPTSLPTLSVSLDAASVVGGTAVSGTVTLSASAPSGGALVTLASNGSAATAPASVTIAAQATTAPFAISTSQVPITTNVQISASSPNTTASSPATLRVQPLPTCGPLLNAEVMVPFSVYVDDGDERNHFIPSGFFGDIADLTLDTNDRSGPHAGTSAIRIDYKPLGNQRFAGIFWQCPENNWGTTPGAGFNLTRARQVQFWARAAAPAKAEFKVGGIGWSPQAPFPDSFPSTPTIEVVDLGTDWRQFTISLAVRDLSRVIGGFMFVTNTSQNPTGLTLFIDDVVWQ